MKTSKGFKLFGCVAACAILGGLAIGLAPKAVELSSRVGGDATKTLTITAAQMQAAADVNGNGTLENIGGVNWSFEKVAFETIGGNLTAKIRQGGFLKNTTASGASTYGGLRGTGFTGAKFYNKVANAGSNFRFYEATNLIDPGLGNQGIAADSAALQNYDFPTWTGKENSIVKIGEIGPGPTVEDVATEGYVGFSSIDFRYGCGTADPTMTLATPKASCGAGETIQLTWTFKNVGGSTPTVTFTSSNEDVATVSENGGLVTGVGAGTTTISASFVYNTVTYYSNTIDIEVVSAVSYRDLSFKNTCNLEGAGVFLNINNIDAGHDNLQILKGGETAKVAVKVLFNGGTNFKGYEGTNNNIDRTPIYVNMADENATAQMHFTVPNGFPDDDDFVHTFKVTITYSPEIIYEGSISITGNKTISATSGHWSA